MNQKKVIAVLRDDLEYATSNQIGPSCEPFSNQVSDALHRSSHLNLAIFKEGDLFLSDESQPSEEGNNPGITLFNSSQANAAKSLLITETFFLLKALKTLTLTPNDKSTVRVVYIGGSPGDHINTLASMWPTLMFDVYDPKPMPKVVKTSNVETFEETFTNAHCERYRNMRTLMISDIRNLAYRPVSAGMTIDEIKLNADMIVADMESQYRWLKLMKPIFALLRFRPLIKHESRAYETKSNNEGGGQCSFTANSFTYPTGVHILMPFAKVTTNSVMLMTTPDSPTALYYHKDIVTRIIRHNIVVRNSIIYMNPFSRSFNALLPISEVRRLTTELSLTADKGLAHYVMNSGWDMRATFFVFALYFKRQKPTITEPELKETISTFLLQTFTTFENATIKPPTTKDDQPNTEDNQPQDDDQ